jgi:hypothetical protein
MVEHVACKGEMKMHRRYSLKSERKRLRKESRNVGFKRIVKRLGRRVASSDSFAGPCEYGGEPLNVINGRLFS